MKSGRTLIKPIFAVKRFWSSVFWLIFLIAGSIFGCAFRAFPIFTAVLTASFIGLNEFGRWPYKTNLVLCAGTAVIAAIAGVFTWVEICSIFALFCVTAAYIRFYRERAARTVPSLEAYASEMTGARSFAELIDRAWDGLEQLAPDSAVFIVLADNEGGLVIPEHQREKARPLRRNGGACWKAFGSGHPVIVNRVETGRDQPLDRDAVSLMAVPITARGEKLGILQLESAASGAFSDEDAAKLSLAAMILGDELYFFETQLPPEEESFAEKKSAETEKPASCGKSETERESGTKPVAEAGPVKEAGPEKEAEPEKKAERQCEEEKAESGAGSAEEPHDCAEDKKGDIDETN